MATIQGGCECGQVRYECSDQFVFVAHCHCRDCQRATGGQMSTVAGVPAASLRVIQGAPRSYAYTGDSGKGLKRNFCGNCGSRLFTNELGAMPDLAFVAVGNLDDPKAAAPQMHVYTASAQPWSCYDATLPRFPGMPG